METPGSRWEKFRATAERAQQEGMYEFAETTWAAALEDAEDFGDTDRRLAYTLEKLAECLWTQGKLNDAANYCKRVLKIYEKVLGPDHQDVACFAGNLAMIYHGRKEYDKAETYYKRSLDIKRKFLPADHPELKKLAGNYADLLHLLGRTEDAAKLKTAASQVTAADWKKGTGSHAAYSKPPAPPAAAPAQTVSHNKVAAVSAPPPPPPGSYGQQNNFSTANRMAAKPKPVPHSGKSTKETKLPPPPTKIGQAIQSKDEVFERWKFHKERAEKATAENKLPDAENEWLAALEAAESIGEENPPLSYTLFSLGELKARQEAYDAAIPFHQRAYSIKRKVLGPLHMAVAASANSLARLFYHMRDYNQAENLAQECVKIYERLLGRDHQDVACALHNLATLYHVQRKYSHAEPAYKRALEIKNKIFGPEHPDTARLLRSYADLMRSTHREDEAEKMDSTATGMITGSWKTIKQVDGDSLQAREDRCDICNAKLGGADRCPKCGFEAAIGVI